MTIRDISKLADELIEKVASERGPVEKTASVSKKKVAFVKVAQAEELKKLAEEIRKCTFSNDITYQDVNSYVNLFK
jgi:hypothetical protein